MSCVVMSCRVAHCAARGGRPTCPDTQDRAGVDQVLCYFSPGASHRCQAVTHVALQSQPGTATHSFALMDHFRGERHDSPSRPGHRRHATSLSRHSQHDMPCRGNVKMPEFTEHKRSLLGAPACPSYDAHHDALLVRIAWAT